MRLSDDAAQGRLGSRLQAFPDIFEIGCAGKIGGLVKLADGRYNLVLEGIGEFASPRDSRSFVSAGGGGMVSGAARRA